MNSFDLVKVENIIYDFSQNTFYHFVFTKNSY